MCCASRKFSRLPILLSIFIWIARCDNITCDTMQCYKMQCYNMQCYKIQCDNMVDDRNVFRSTPPTEQKIDHEFLRCLLCDVRCVAYVATLPLRNAKLIADASPFLCARNNNNNNKKQNEMVNPYDTKCPLSASRCRCRCPLSNNQTNSNAIQSTAAHRRMKETLHLLSTRATLPS